MGCGDAGPYFPGKRYEDWMLEPGRPGHRLRAPDPRRDPHRILGLLDERGVQPVTAERR
jgi:hypothetical protein